MQSFKLIISLLVMLQAVCICSCDSKKSKQVIAKEEEHITVHTKSDYETAADYLAKLRDDNADTIIFYKRTCINCCDFFNIFWATNGKVFLKKIFYNGEADTAIIEIKNDTIFKKLAAYYANLKHSTIKTNGHKIKNGLVVTTSVDHYCYTEINIFSVKDSIKTGQIKDHDFDKYTNYDQTEKGQLNDNFFYNNNCDWNIFLKTIESELAGMKETGQRELEMLRTIKKK